MVGMVSLCSSNNLPTFFAKQNIWIARVWQKSWNGWNNVVSSENLQKKHPDLPSIPSKSEPDSTKARATPPGGQGQGGFVCEWNRIRKKPIPFNHPDVTSPEEADVHYLRGLSLTNERKQQQTGRKSAKKQTRPSSSRGRRLWIVETKNCENQLWFFPNKW